MTTRRKRVDPAERTLPHNLDAERSVLGAILVHNDAYDTAAQQLQGAHFYRDAHRRIWEAMRILIDERKIVADFVTLREELTKRQELDEVGGPAYLSSLADGVPRATNVRYYASIVRDKAMLRDLIFAANRILTAAYEGEQEPPDLLRSADRALLAIATHGLRDGMLPLNARLRAVTERLEYRVAHKGELTGVDTGFDSINGETLGWQPGDLIIIGARPSIGKTAFMLNSILAAVRGHRRAAVFSLEMTRAQLEDRILAILAGIDAQRIRSGHIAGLEYPRIAEAFEVMHGLPLAIDDTSRVTMAEIRAICRRLKAEEGLDLVVVDYIQLVPGTLDRRGSTRNDEVTDIATRGKDLAKELGVPILILSQLTRANEKRPDPRPKLSDLRESGSLEQIADVVAFLHRRHHRESGTTNFIIEKQRNGPTGSCNLTFDRDTQTFTDGGVEPPEPEKSPRKPSDRTRTKARGSLYEGDE